MADEDQVTCAEEAAALLRRAREENGQQDAAVTRLDDPARAEIRAERLRIAEGFIRLAGRGRDRWWVTTGPLADGGQKELGPFGSQELAMKVRSYMELASQEHGSGGTYWVDEDG